MTDYHEFHKYAIRARGQQVLIVGKPGVWSWDELNPGTAALLEIPRVEPDERVLDLGCGTGAIGAVAGLLMPQGHITLVDCNIAAVRCAERTVRANELTNADVHLTDGVEGLAPSTFDLVLSHLPRGREVQHRLIRSAAWVLKPEGRLYFVTHKRYGVKSAIQYARELFGRCGVVRQKKGYHVAMAVKPPDMTIHQPAKGYTEHPITLDGEETLLVSKPGVFAWNRLDAGTRALVQTMTIETTDRVLDLGCGTGLAGLAAARRADEGTVTLVDADIRAIESSQRTLAANDVDNAEVLISDCAAAVFDREPFDVVISNPPFHQGVEVDYDVAWQFVCDAKRVLKPHGRFFLVANRFLGYNDLMEETFDGVRTTYDDGSYHVLTATVLSQKT
jgi:16S rRNA (guanine1207-N2)-methyltransferase